MNSTKYENTYRGKSIPSMKNCNLFYNSKDEKIAKIAIKQYIAGCYVSKCKFAQTQKNTFLLEIQFQLKLVPVSAETKSVSAET